MTALDDAAAHLAKAREFLAAAISNHDLELFNASTSDSVTSGVNSKDAICLKLTGRTNKSERHEDAVDELIRAGRAGKDVASVLNRLLKLKTRSQYQTTSIAAADAARAIDWATRLFEAAQQVVTS